MHGKNNYDFKYENRIKDITFTPIFIIGIARSGTTFLYKMLTKTKKFDYVNFYHIKCYDKLLSNYINDKEQIDRNKLKQFFVKKNVYDRGLDKIEAKIDSPEEYQFLLYEKTKIPNIDKKNISYFIELGKKIKFISNNNKPILFKSITDQMNFMSIKNFFPDAKFIFTHRHPMDILNSTRVGGKTLYNDGSQYFLEIDKKYKKYFEEPLLRGIMKVFYSEYNMLSLLWQIKMITREMKYFTENISNLDKRDYINVTYEKIIEQPNQVIEDIMAFLDIEYNNEIDYNEMISPRNLPYLRNVYSLRRYYQKNTKEYCDIFNYKEI